MDGSTVKKKMRTFFLLVGVCRPNNSFFYLIDGGREDSRRRQIQLSDPESPEMVEFGLKLGE